MEDIDLKNLDLDKLRRTAEAGEEAKRILRDLERHSLAGSVSPGRQALPQNHDLSGRLAYMVPGVEEAQEYRPVPHASLTQGPIQSRSQWATPGATATSAPLVYRYTPPQHRQSDQRQQERQAQNQVPPSNHVGQQLYPRYEPYTNAAPPLPLYPPHHRASWSSAERQQPMAATRDFAPVLQFGSQHRQHPRQRVDAGQRAQHQNQSHEQQQQTWQRSEHANHPPSGNEVLPNNIATTSSPTIMSYHKQTGQRSEMQIAMHHSQSDSGVIPSNVATALNTTTTRNHMLASSNSSSNLEVVGRKNNEAAFLVNTTKSQAAKINGSQSRPASNPSLPVAVGNQASLLPPFKGVPPLQRAQKQADGSVPNSHHASQGVPPPPSVISNALRQFRFAGTQPPTQQTTNYHHPAQPQAHLYPENMNLHSTEPSTAKGPAGYHSSPFPAVPPNLEPPFTVSRHMDQHKQSSSSISKQSSNRSPSQADKKHLARDVLRALKPSAPAKFGPKRPRLEDCFTDLVGQSPAQRHALEPGVSSPGSSSFSEQYLSLSSQHLPPQPVALPSQPPVQFSQAPQPTSVMSISMPSQTTPLLPTSRPPSIQPAVSMLPAPTSTTTDPTPSTLGQDAAEPSSVSTSRTILPMPQSVTRPSTSSVSELKSTLTTLATSGARVRPVVELPASAYASTSTLLSRRKPLVPSGSVPANDILPATPPMRVMSRTTTVPQPSSSKHRSSQDRYSETREQTPLFLPSPMSSSIDLVDDTRETTISEDPLQIGGPDDTMTDLGMIERRKPIGRHMRTTTMKPYVLVPRRPEYLRIYKANQLEEAKRRKSRIRPVLEKHTSESEQWSLSRLQEEPDINYSDPASFDFVTDDDERQAMVLSCSRVIERPCKWSGCDVVMDSAAKLVKHFALEHRPRKSSKSSFVCLWQQCGKRLTDAKKLFIHLRNHATLPLSCGYEDCDESFRNPSQLVKHHQAEHRRDSPKPPATFFAPRLGPLPVAPQVLPSFMIEARQVRQPSISKERHAFLGPWVLRKIAGPVNLGTRRYNAAQPLRSVNGTEERSGNKPYDFLTFPSVQYSSALSQPSKIRTLDDLDSGEISEMIHDGMILWPDIKKEEHSLDGMLDEVSESNSIGTTKSWGPDSNAIIAQAIP